MMHRNLSPTVCAHLFHNPSALGYFSWLSRTNVSLHKIPQTPLFMSDSCQLSIHSDSFSDSTETRRLQVSAAFSHQ